MTTITEEFKVGDCVEYAGLSSPSAVILAINRNLRSAAVGSALDNPTWIDVALLSALRRHNPPPNKAEKKAGDILRLVEVIYRVTFVGDQPRHIYETQPRKKALFHQFGVGYTRVGESAVEYTTAIVELPDGQIESVPAQYVKFLQPNS